VPELSSQGEVEARGNDERTNVASYFSTDFFESHLRRILFAAAYYNQARTPLALQKDAPVHRAVQRTGVIVAIPILAGLHHQYVRM
jgi:hypothetical protein